MRDTDVAKMLLEAEKPEEAPSIKVEFQKGDHIKIREGAFENFEGTVDSIDSEQRHREGHCHDLRAQHAAGYRVLADREGVSRRCSAAVPFQSPPGRRFKTAIRV